MHDWSTDILTLAVGFVMLGKGAGWLVDGGASLARRWGVSPMTVGLTVVAWGTSMPELVVSGLAASRGMPASSLGNVLGSNVANVALVLGASALVLPSVLIGRVGMREGVWLLGSLAVLWGICWDLNVTRMEGLLLVVTFGVYYWILFRAPRPGSAETQAHGARYPWAGVIVGSLLIAGGAALVMRAGIRVADRLGMADTVLGLTILAVGTSLPELFAGVGSALKGHAEIGIGNVFGSNVFNTLAVMGCAALIQPFGTGESEAAELRQALARDFPATLAFSLVLVGLPLVLKGRAGGRLAGSFLLAVYFVYMGYVVFRP